MEKVPTPNLSKSSSVVATWAKLRSLAITQCELHSSLAKTKTDHERTALQHQIEHTDRQIDALVYELYGLTDQEIALVEEATK